MRLIHFFMVVEHHLYERVDLAEQLTQPNYSTIKLQSGPCIVCNMREQLFDHCPQGDKALQVERIYVFLC